MHREQRKSLIGDLNNRMQQTLEGYRFESSARLPAIEHLCFFQWNRIVKWRNEIVRVSFSEIDFDSVLVTLEVDISMSPSSRVAFDGISLRYLTHGKSGTYYLPTFLFNKSGFIKTVISDLIIGLEWFHEFCTPQECVARLETGKTLMGNLTFEGRIQEVREFLISKAN